jgi:hypothetical protein
MRSIRFPPTQRLPQVRIPWQVTIQGQDYTLKWLKRFAATGVTSLALGGVAAYVAGPALARAIRRSGTAVHSYLTVPTAPRAQNTTIDLPGLNPIREV